MVTISPRFLKANATISVAGTFRFGAGSLTVMKLVDADELLLALRLGDACRLSVLASTATQVAGRTTSRRTAEGGHRLRKVRIHCFLIDRTALALLATVVAIGEARAGGTAATTANLADCC